MALVLDTGPILAALDADDQHHVRCLELIEATSERRIIPAPVLPELDYWCHERLGVDAFLDLLDDVERGSFTIEELRPSDYRRIRELCVVYRDLRVGFVDAAVLALVERFGEDKLATLDHRHFGVMRPRHTDSLELLPGP